MADRCSHQEHYHRMLEPTDWTGSYAASWVVSRLLHHQTPGPVLSWPSLSPWPGSDCLREGAPLPTSPCVGGSRGWGIEFDQVQTMCLTPASREGGEEHPESGDPAVRGGYQLPPDPVQQHFPKKGKEFSTGMAED